MSDETTFVILGSCVTRDAFEVIGDRPWKLNKYMARTSLGSFFAKPTHSIEPDYSRFASPFRRRMVEEDITKTGAQWLAQADFDVLVYDMIDERFNLARFPDGGICTISAEFEELGIPEDAHEVVPQESDEFWERWEQGWSQLVAHLDSRGLRDRLVVHDAPWAERIAASDDDRFQRPYVRRANAWLARAMQRIRQDIPEGQIVRVADEHHAVDADHKWGLTPFHYVQAYYHDFNRRLELSETLSSDIDLTKQMVSEGAPLGASIDVEPTDVDVQTVGPHPLLVSVQGEFPLREPLHAWFPEASQTLRCEVRGYGAEGSSARAALLSFELEAAEGVNVTQALVGRTDVAWSPLPGIGWYRYLVTSEGDFTDVQLLRLPNGVSCRGVAISGWGEGVATVSVRSLIVGGISSEGEIFPA